MISDFSIKTIRLWMFSAVVCPSVFGQRVADSLVLPPVEIRANRLAEHSVGLKITKLDSISLASATNLSEALANQNECWIANYGPGSLATISARGAFGARTAVLWNGLNLQSPMHGVADGSLFPVFEGDEISVQSGGASALFGSGAMGGAVLLSSGFPTQNGWSGAVGFKGGSFDERLFDASIFNKNHPFFNKKIAWASGFRAQFHRAENDFPFKNTTLIGQPDTFQTNAFFNKQDFQQLNKITFSEKTMLTTAAWLTESFRQIPPSMTAAASHDWQRDTVFRVSVALLHQIRPHFSIETRLAWLYESILFHYSLGDEFSRAKTVIGEAEARWQKRRSTVRLGWFSDFQNALSKGYGSIPFFRNSEAIFAAQTIDFQRIRFAWTARVEIASGRFSPPTGSIGLEKKDDSSWKWRLHFSKNYHLPTFNDLFWASSGNPNLKSENGWNGEAGLRFSKKKWAADWTAFGFLIDDWIEWKPSAENPNFYQPQNHRKVLSSGLEASFKTSFQLSNWTFLLKTNYRFNFFRNLKFYQNETTDAPIRQPNQQAAAHFTARRGAFSIRFSQNFTGFSPDLALAGFKNYSVGSLAAFYSINKIKRLRSLDFSIQIENIFNAAYQIIPFRAMPSRSFRGSVRFHF